jgi:mRNA m6A methyltransferase catalytic subunit
MLKRFLSHFQWIQCDLRSLDLSVLGKFAVLMADPPWDIHMELPYGTMSDDEMRRLPIPSLQVNLTAIIDTTIHP